MTLPPKEMGDLLLSTVVGITQSFWAPAIVHKNKETSSITALAIAGGSRLGRSATADGAGLRACKQYSDCPHGPRTTLTIQSEYC